MLTRKIQGHLLTQAAIGILCGVCGAAAWAQQAAPVAPPATTAPAANAPPATAAPVANAAPAAPIDETFDIRGYAVSGNTLLPQVAIDALLKPFTGDKRLYADIQKALEALEGAYRSRGFSAVQVFVPEQTLDTGTVKLTVVEAKVKLVKIEGNAFFDEANIRAALPALTVGKTPNARNIAANVRVANESPARQVDVVLGAGEQEDEVNATVTVSDSVPRKFLSSVDNTGSNATGLHRVMVGFQHGNLFNADHVLTAQYTTSLEKPSLVDIYSFGYRVPLYQLDGSVDVIYAKSSVSSGTTGTVAGPLTFTGKGNIFGLRFNQYLPRQGEFTHQITYAFDYKAFENACTLGTFGAAGCGSAAFPVTVHPLSATYSGAWAGLGKQTGFSVTATGNWSWGGNGLNQNFAAVRPAAAGAAQGGAKADFIVFKGSLSHSRVLPADLQLRGSLSGQWTPQALIAQEHFGLAGSTGVRGFQEREFARDRGLNANIELYGPEWGDKLIAGSNLRMLVFYDVARGYNYRLAGDADQRLAIASLGLGMRFNLGKMLTLRADYARVTDVRAMNATSSQVKGDARGHFSLALSF